MDIFDCIENFSYKIAEKYGKNDSQDDIELYKYFIFVILSNLFTSSVGLLLSIIFGYFKYYIISDISFVLLRTVGGGSHCDTFKKCFFMSNIISILNCIIAVFGCRVPYIIILLSFIATILILPICPKPSENSPSRGYDGDIKFRKKFSYRFIFMIFVAIIANHFNLNFITSSVCSGIISVCFITSNIGEVFINKLSNLFE